MAAPDLSLLTKRRFAPLFVVQFIGAFNDNVLKFAMLFLADFTIYVGQPGKAAMLATIATGVFILPYFLFSSVAGQVADAWDKTRLVRIVKTAEVIIMSLGLVGLWTQSIPALMTALFLMGCHSTIFGPVKYSIMPQLLHRDEVMGGTGMIEAGTFLAILGGQLLAGVLHPWEAGLAATALAVVGLATSFAMPSTPATAPGLKIDFNIARGTWHILKEAHTGRGLWLSIVGISWFFAVGAVILSEFAPLVSGRLGAEKDVVTLFLLTFSVSIAIGSLAVNRLLRGVISARYVPAAAFAMGLFMIALWWTTQSYVPPTRGMHIAAFVASDGAPIILFSLVGLALAGGMFIVPLYAILQTQSPPEARSQIIAANNIINAIVTVVMVAVIVALLGQGLSIPGVIGALGLATLPIGLMARALPDDATISAPPPPHRPAT